MSSVISTPIPGGAGGYLNADLAAKQAYQNALASLNNQRQSTLRNYGYLGDVNPTTGLVSNMRVDPHNPYGQYQNMLNTGASEITSSIDDAVSRGIGGGLARQGITAAHHDFGAASSQLGQSLQSQLQGYTDDQTAAQNTMNDTLWQAQLQAAQDAIAQQAFNPGDYSNITDPGMPNYGDPTNPTTPKQPSTKPVGKVAPHLVKKLVNSKVASHRTFTAPKSGYAPGGVTYKHPAARPAAKKRR